MHDQADQDRPIETIEEMPAAPEADQGTRDADAPTWSPPTEGHLDPPVAAAHAEAAPAADEAPAASPDAIPELITGDRIEVNQGGAQRIEGREITINQGGAAVIRAERIRVEQGGAALIVADSVELHEGGAFLILARRVSGDVNVALDWRALAAIFAGIVAILVVRGRR